MIVSTSVTSAGGGCAGSDFPPVGISPARIGVDSTHMSASAIANRFMDVTPFEVLRKMPRFFIKRNGAELEQQRRKSCKVG